VLQKLLRAPALLGRAWMALSYAMAHDCMGIEFDLFGRRLGWSMLAQGRRSGWQYVLNPVSVPRYFEFEFAAACLPACPSKCLDVSSPRLFSLYVARRNPQVSILMLNPDRGDIALSSTIHTALNLSNIHTAALDVRALASSPDTYDCIWSISVVEHIAGEYDDRDAVRHMYAALKPGGRLILTIPVDRTAWDEYRDADYYGLQSPQPRPQQYFFQRFYDEASLQERLLNPIGRKPTVVRWLGETTAGHFADYIQRWLRDGINCTVDDPREMVDHYREYGSWASMPGMGICGLMIQKD